MTEASEYTGGWMVEVMDDGVSGRHKRYLVAASSRVEATKLVQALLGPDAIITSVTVVPTAALGAHKVDAGKVMPL